MKHLFAYMRAGLFMCFILMQGMAPLAHAHVNGQNSDGHVHVEIEGMHQHVEASAGMQAVNIEHDHSSVVTLPPEHRCKDVLFVPALCASSLMVQPPLQHTVLSYQAAAAPALPFLHCLPPHSQAPPV